ncbi:TIGR03617 family F420-dependent LLM class oxidoreductase [Kineosporia sp. NBRC 101731]|uniref:TIGR03617 family F420-dependent LLM class oxidoreductase n=1 Tax=Kineosporia sp. NBRC 101731 TaxID=3032199 RepID=UPI0024A5CE33|nr:TIGR03617 family F420-dependent LLM class oxidoreductase [Kineosporia sp. NBRC 101731]GLY32453.1 LLM class F420-dependent oxidoreductase [Kineosporia sp. NBRC 101731]
MEIRYLALSAPPAQLAQTARVMEEVGFAGVDVAEANHDPFVSLTAAATATHRLGLRTAVAVAFARNPMNVAMLAHDLQTLSGGRFQLGLGTQLSAHIIKRFSMPWSQPVSRMREFVQALHAIWDAFEGEGSLRYRGQIYRHTLMVPFFNPGPSGLPRPPVMLGGVGERMTQLAGEVADGFLCHNISSPLFLKEVTLPALERGRESAGRTMEGFRLHVSPMVATGSDEEQLAASKERIRAQLAFYTATPSYAKLLELHGLSEMGAELQRLAMRGRTADMAAAVDDSALNTLAFVGEPQDVARRLHESYGGVVDSMSFYEPVVTDPRHWLTIMDELRRLDAVPV